MYLSCVADAAEKLVANARIYGTLDSRGIRSNVYQIGPLSTTTNSRYFGFPLLDTPYFFALLSPSYSRGITREESQRGV